MIKSFAIALLLALLGIAGPVSAQTEPSKLEAYGGFYYAQFNINANVSGFPPRSTYNGYGGGGQLEYNATNVFGIAGDLAGYYVPTGYSAGAFSYLFGPRVNFRRRKLTPFAQVLPGGILTSSGIGQFGPQNHFAMAAGGGH